jgi:hypothetical protein
MRSMGGEKVRGGGGILIKKGKTFIIDCIIWIILLDRP